MTRKKMSQSLVNEGRFPHKNKDGNQYLKFTFCRNPSLMRAGFHRCKDGDNL